MIHRANGINCGRGNSLKGLYRPGCSFERKYGYPVKRRDIEDFVRQFGATGSVERGVTFEEWLINKASQAGWSSQEPEEYTRTSFYQPTQQPMPQQEPQGSDALGVLGGILGIILIILVIIFRKQIWAFIVLVGKIFLVFFGIAIVVGIIGAIRDR